MLLPEILRWAAVAAIAAAVIRPASFWAVNAGRPFVLARAAVGPSRFRRAAPY